MRKGFFGLLIFFVILSSAFAGEAKAEVSAQPFGERADFNAYLDAISREHGFERQALGDLFTDVQSRQDIIERMTKPAERVWTWARYRSHLVDDARVQRGVVFWAEHAATLARAQEEYGVAAEYIVAILGIETRYGEVKGDFPVLDALTTLGFDYPPRATFFRKELTEFLLLAREEKKDPRTLLGSYAGAMGYGQFISSSYRYYAVDFDADGVRDIWQNPVDAIGSVANYFHRHKWQGTHAVAVPVTLASADLAALANQGLELRYSVGALEARGVKLDTQALPVDPQSQAALFRFDGQQGDEYWLGLHDFYVITRYNRSHMYAMAVYQLAQKIRQQRELGLQEGLRG